jgi:hypothetical protein
MSSLPPQSTDAIDHSPQSPQTSLVSLHLPSLPTVMRMFSSSTADIPPPEARDDTAEGTGAAGVVMALHGENLPNG